MNPENCSQESFFLFRRTQETFPEYVIGVPVLFAFAIVFLVFLFRQEKRWSTLLWSLLVVALGSAVYVGLALVFRPLFSWWVVLAPILAIALGYAGLMYFKDA